MVTVGLFRGWRIVIYTNDHRPAHVHVLGDRNEARFSLHCPDGPVTLLSNRGFSKTQLTAIRDHLDDDVGYYCEKWRGIHGTC